MKIPRLHNRMHEIPTMKFSFALSIFYLFPQLTVADFSAKRNLFQIDSEQKKRANKQNKTIASKFSQFATVDPLTRTTIIIMHDCFS